MINNLHLKNFRQHTDLTLDFSEGVTVMRGSNEAGKSTIFEAVTFALFGLRACRNNDLSTWGADPNSHVVTVSFSLNGVTYSLRRSARAAELTYEGGRVTGQTEVTRFCEQILDLKPGMGSKLMFVGQNGIRGILEEGGAKTSQMIETLADFDMIEQWIEVLQSEFGTGKTELYEQSLQGLEQQLAGAEAELNALPDPEAEADKLKRSLVEAHTALTIQLEAADKDLSLAALALEQAENFEAQAEQLQQQITRNQAELDTHQKYLETPLPEVSQVSAAAVAYEKLQGQKSAWDDFQVACHYQPRRHLTISKENLTESVERAVEAETELAGRVSNLAGEIRALKGHLHTDLACSVCKREWDNAEQMLEANRQTQAQIEKLQAELTREQAQLEKARTALNSLQAYDAQTAPTIPENSRWKLVDDGFYPPLYEWQGETPNEITQRMLDNARRAADDERLQQELLQKQLQVRATAEQQIQTLAQTIADLQAEVTRLPESRKSSDIRREVQDLRHKSQDLNRQLQDVQRALDGFDEQVKPWFERRDSLVEKIARLKEEVDRYRSTIADTRINNQLLRALRTIKPQVANKIWQTVCSTVSHYFSLMRDQQSVVTKGDGFVVDGKDVSSLSGSTLDILGIAIRIALTKTFMPSCRFLFLDEPFAACDAQRQAQALGFITSTGFDQVIVVTHEDTTEAVADNLIAL